MSNAGNLALKAGTEEISMQTVCHCRVLDLAPDSSVNPFKSFERNGPDKRTSSLMLISGSGVNDRLASEREGDFAKLSVSLCERCRFSL